MPRRTWTDLTDAQLLAQCEVDTYRASGPGGQKRNKTSSAVRLRHPPTGLLVIAEESRSQHENKEKALRRLRRTLHLELREPPPLEDGVLQCPALEAVRTAAGKVEVGRRDPRFWPAAAAVLDVLASCEARVADTAALLGISTGHLIGFLETDEHLWQQANRLRTKFGHKPLKTGA